MALSSSPVPARNAVDREPSGDERKWSMRRDDVNEMGLAIVVVVVALLVADCIWMHVKCARHETEIAALSERVEALSKPPAADSRQDDVAFVDKAIKTIEKVKSAAVKGFEAAKDEYSKDKGDGNGKNR